MDRMFSYCSNDCDQSSLEIGDSHQELFDLSQPSELDYTNDHYGHSRFAFEQDLRKNNEQLAAIIKQQEQKITSYRNHIETIEDEYSKVSSSLVATERELEQQKKKIYSYEYTIASLRSEVDSFYNIDRSTKTTSSTSESSNLNLGLPFQTIHNKDAENSNFSDKVTNEAEHKKFENILNCFKGMCEQNNELKAENELLKKEISRLLKDNEDFQNLLWNSKEDFSRNSSKKFKVSTPIKNFISYQSLNINKNTSFSIDDDYEYENITCENDTFSKKRTINPFETNFSVSKMSSSIWIENEEMPSKMDQIKEDPTNCHLGQISNSLFSESVKKTINEISSIENEKMPQVEISESTITHSTGSSQVGSMDLVSKPSMGLELAAARAQLPTPNHLTSQDVQRVTLTCKLLNYLHTFLWAIFIATLIRPCKTSHLRLVTSFGRKILYAISLYAILILILKQNISYFDTNTTITPFYSLQEILFDILSQQF